MDNYDIACLEGTGILTSQILRYTLEDERRETKASDLDWPTGKEQLRYK